MHVYWNKNCIKGRVSPFKIIRIICLLTTCEYELLDQADRRFSVMALVLCTMYRVIRNDFRAWPPRFPESTLCDFFLWGYVKDQVYFPPLPACIPELKVRIRTAIETITADMLQTVWNELDYRVDVCRIRKGAHVEHL